MGKIKRLGRACCESLGVILVIIGIFAGLGVCFFIGRLISEALGCSGDGWLLIGAIIAFFVANVFMRLDNPDDDSNLWAG